MDRKVKEFIMREAIKAAEEFVKKRFINDTTGHDWQHMDRVRRLSLLIYQTEQTGDPELIELIALLHDLSDSKLNGTKKAGEAVLSEWLESNVKNEEIRGKIKRDVSSISFSEGLREGLSPEAAIVQDADRLDALGAIGIARAFAYGSHKGHPIYLPKDDSAPSTFTHFYDKLLLLKTLMNTRTGKRLAEERHQFILLFLEQFKKDMME
ncbi:MULTISPECIES: HD domain-containing protein [Bacillaceae]|uniref:HD domain-containing protein n=1 Tax=Bacillaceae TaxID=186817 RepID=UPI001CEF9EEE|nr:MULTISPECIES: HD domain-containing protein [Bacillaceae]